MNLTAKNRSRLILLICLGIFAGTLAWEMLERILASLGVVISVSAGPIGIDLHVLALSMRVNPGTLIGIGGGVTLFRIL